jgi:Zn finger protein HypA/HybF involved in hydrogenase expression
MNKQIEEIRAMAKCLACNVFWDEDEILTVNCLETAKRLYLNGYRKSTDIALEVIGEVVSKAKAIFCPDCDYDVADIRYNLDWLEAELKKKYESEGADDEQIH